MKVRLARISSQILLVNISGLFRLKLTEFKLTHNIHLIILSWRFLFIHHPTARLEVCCVRLLANQIRIVHTPRSHHAKFIQSFSFQAFLIWFFCQTINSLKISSLDSYNINLRLLMNTSLSTNYCHLGFFLAWMLVKA